MASSAAGSSATQTFLATPTPKQAFLAIPSPAGTFLEDPTPEVSSATYVTNLQAEMAQTEAACRKAAATMTFNFKDKARLMLDTDRFTPSPHGNGTPSPRFAGEDSPDSPDPADVVAGLDKLADRLEAERFFVNQHVANKSLAFLRRRTKHRESVLNAEAEPFVSRTPSPAGSAPCSAGFMFTPITTEWAIPGVMVHASASGEEIQQKIDQITADFEAAKWQRCREILAHASVSSNNRSVVRLAGEALDVVSSKTAFADDPAVFAVPVKEDVLAPTK